MTLKYIKLTPILIIFLCACSTSLPVKNQIKPSPGRLSQITPGSVEMFMEKGVTTKSKVISHIGAPNIITKNESGNCLWIYEISKTTITQQNNSQGSHATLHSSDSSSGMSKSSDKSQEERTSKKMTLMICFTQEDIVESYDYVYTSF